MILRSVCVYCGSAAGVRPGYAAAARALGAELARRGLRLVYGGGQVGLMGILADSVLAAGGQVVGVIPHALQRREVAHLQLTELHVVDTMHERKALMTELSDAFIALPGGFGTLDELCEALTWAQLGIHSRPVGLCDIDDYFAALLAFFDHAVAEGFLFPAHRALLLHDTDHTRLLDRLAAWQPPATAAWASLRDA